MWILVVICLSVFFFCKHLTLPGGDSKYCFSKISFSPKALFIWKKLFLGRRVNFRAESTSASIYMRKKVDPFTRVKSARACSDYLEQRSLTLWLGTLRSNVATATKTSFKKWIRVRSFSLYSDFYYPLTLLNVGEPSWSWISCKHIQAQKEK